MFKLAERCGGSAGLYCGSEGLFLGPSPLIARIGAGYRIRDEREVRSLLAAAYGTSDIETLPRRLPLIREALQQGDLCRATILAVQARLGPMRPEGIKRLARTEALAKYNFKPRRTSRLARPLDRLGGRHPDGFDRHHRSSRLTDTRPPRPREQ